MNFVQSIIELLKSFWPLAKVQNWEDGNYYVFGKWWKTFRGGRLLFVPPWFCEVFVVSVTPSPISTPRMDLTLKSGAQLSFTATAVMQVEESAKALNEIDDYRESTQEILGAVLADRLSRIAEDKLDAENRAALLRDLRDRVDAETSAFGVRARSVRFTTFVINARQIRLLQDGNVQPW